MTGETVRVLDLYSGPGGVGIALDALGIEHVGVDIEDYSETYPTRLKARVRGYSWRWPTNV